MLLTVNGKDVGKVDTFQISYVHSHGLRVVNTEPVLKKDADSANIELITDEETVLLKFKDGVNTYTGGKVGTSNKVIVKIPFDGEILFTYRVCGCEKTGPSILLFLAVPLSIILSVIGLFLIIKRTASSVTRRK